jgi:phosphatidylglycerol---prolipoprotein diacylglyceryl transferase
MADAAAHHYWVHDLSPFAIRFTDSIGIRWYGLAYIAGLVCAGLLVRRWIKQGRVPMRLAELQDFVVVGGIAMVVGGRLGYCLFYAWDLLVADPLYIFKLWEGGMASHGGIVGLFAGAWWFAWRRKRSLLVLCDAVCASAPIGVIFGRVANFVNGELWGRPTRVPWAVIFPGSEDGVPRHPSQLYAAVLEGLVPLLIILPIHARHRRPGLTMGALLLLYGIGRFADEFFREPDRGAPIFFGWMSEGQLLTLPLLVIGAVLMVWAGSRPSRPEAYSVPPPLRPDPAVTSAP